MDLAIVHYHLGHGGVTRVISNQLTSLAASCPPTESLRVLVLHGGRDDGWHSPNLTRDDCSVVQHTIPGLDYDSDKTPDATTLAHQLRDAMREHAFFPDQTIVHVHNHSLGKNCALPPALRILADEGYRLLLQIHDFAEDLRPANYRKLTAAFGTDDPQEVARILYPQSHKIHYAVLNSRDREILVTAGVKPVTLLPNPVFELGELVDPVQAKSTLARQLDIPVELPFILYPVRAIRRKNVGEALLWAALAKPTAYFGISLPTLNPTEQNQYQEWKRLAAELQLPFRFELGISSGLRFEQNLAAADGILTTSLAEGFGMVYLEPWLANRAVIGRDLPDITVDFKNAGVVFESLSPRLWIPDGLFDHQTLLDKLHAAYRDVCLSYGKAGADVLSAVSGFEAKVSNGVDFGDLDEPMQAEVIRHVATQEDFRGKILQANPWLQASFSATGDFEQIQANRQVVSEQYGAERSGQRLWDVYRQLLAAEESPTNTDVSAAELLRQFLHPARFRLLRT